ncbi:AP2 domain-containing protein [Phage CBW1004C-Prop1]|nr:AP2 domain-containing protein [Phage CBW1004C-Prop1]
MTRAIDMTGNRYNELVAIKRVGSCRSGDAKWLFQCDCGNQFSASGYAARTSKIINCPQCAKERAKTASIKHGRAKTSEFGIWTDMQTRCLNPNSTSYPNYGGRGIGICQRWMKFQNFFQDMGPRPSMNHSIDRIDPDGDYSPDNCRWATHKEQSRNKRNTIRVTINGVTKPLVEWCEEYGCGKAAAYQRRARGLDGEQIFLGTDQRITFKGITDTFSGWSKRTGIKPNTLAMRVNKYQWPVEKALTKGAKRCL